MEPQPEARSLVRSLLAGQKLAALATHHNGQPYASLVAFAADDDLKQLFFVTSRTTRKYANLSADGRVALLIHNSADTDADFRRAAAVTATGGTSEVPDSENEAVLRRYLDRHPLLEEFARSADSALICVRVASYVLVMEFQKVVELRMEA